MIIHEMYLKCFSFTEQQQPEHILSDILYLY